MSSFFLNFASTGFLPKHIMPDAMQRSHEGPGSSRLVAGEVLRTAKYRLHACSSVECRGLGARATWA